jgi:hypothetical protein
MPDNEAFITSVDMALQFFQLCHDLQITDEKARLQLLREMTAKNKDKIKYVRDVKPVLAGKKVLVVHHKEPKNDDRKKS